jgi:methionine biosynthesis protein MetW
MPTENNRTADLNEYWKDTDRARFSKKFDHLKGFLPEDFNSVLDIGGGTGALHDSLTRWKSHEYTVVDLSPEAVTQAKSRGLQALVWDIDSAALPFPDNSFDIVVATHVLEHIRNPWAVLAQMTRVSRKYVCLYSPNFAFWKCRLDLLRGRPIRSMSDKWGSAVDRNGQHNDHIFFITYANTIHWADELGLKVINRRAWWYRRYTPVRWILEPAFNNFGENFELILEKPRNFSIPDNLNFHFS